MNGATTIQERLKDLRLNKGLKLEELAEQTGISKSALGSYEKDDFKEINHGNLILLADFYGVSFLYVKIICYKNVSYFQPIFLIPAKTDYIIGCKSDTNIDEKDR